MADVDQKMMFSPGLCGHFALGAFSKIYLKDVVFEMNVFANKKNKLTKSKNLKFDIKIKNRFHNQILSCLN